MRYALCDMFSQTATTTTKSKIPTWANWRNALLLGLAIFIVRLIYLAWLNPYELAADEAHYWEWGRYLDWSYYTKGPGIGWTNFASSALFGPSEWSVRMPAALFSLGTLLIVGKMAWDISRDARAAFFAAAIFALAPCFQAVSQFMTIDMPFFFFWALAAWASVRILLTNVQNARLFWWATLGFAMGVGCLYKYTILLLIPGFIIFLLWDRSWVKTWTSQLPGLLIALFFFALTMLPIIIWNHQYGWPTILHLMGHLNMEGGDVGVNPDKRYTPLWTLSMLVEQAGILAPPIVALIVLAVMQTLRHRRAVSPDATEASEQDLLKQADLLMICLGLTIVLFYLLVSFMTPPLANWPIAGYLTLIALAGKVSVSQYEQYQQQVAAWEALPTPRPKMGWMRAKPETCWQVSWHWAIGVGVVVQLCIMFIPYLAVLPLPEPLERGLGRISGHREAAGELDAIYHTQKQALQETPFLVANFHAHASLMAFYMQDQPTIYCANSYMGGRTTNYDFFPETDLRNPDLHGQNAILIGSRPENWLFALRFDTIESIGDAAGRSLYLGRNYQGLADPSHAPAPAEDASSASPR